MTRSKELLAGINERVRKIRKDNGLTMAEFAEKVGVSSGNVGDWESSTKKSSPSATALIAIASNFDISLDWLLLNKPINPDRYTQTMGRASRISNGDEKIFTNEWQSNYQFDIESMRESTKNLLLNIQKLQDEDIDMLNTFATRLARNGSYIPNPSENIIIRESTDKDEFSTELHPEESNIINRFYVPFVGAAAAGSPMTAIGFIDGYMEVPYKQQDCFCVKVQGDSMEPTIQNGGFVIVRKQAEVENGELALVMVTGDIEDRASIKRIRIEPERVVLSSENTEYSPLYFDRGNVTILGKIIDWMSPSEGIAKMKKEVF